jgi:hypothetical protein
MLCTKQYLTHHWPISCGEIDSKDMTLGNATCIILDRFGNENSALALIGYSLSLIDDLKFYNKSLSQEEILELMNHNETSKHFYLIKVLYDQV